MKLIKCLLIILFVSFFSLNLNSFPKKKHSIIKDKIDRSQFENIMELGYYYGYLEYCGYPKTENKHIYKRIKGLVAYTNWDLFLIFNKGIQDVHTTLVIAGVGWAGGNTYIDDGVWQQHKIKWKYDLKNCGDTRSLTKSYDSMDEIINNVLINFMLARDNYQDNFNQLISALTNDKKDDYSSIILMLKNATNPNFKIKTNKSENNTLTSQNSINQDSSDDIRTQLKKIKLFFEEDLITEDEYVAKKKELLDKL